MEEMTTFIEGVPQVVPESWCMECKICCRFPDTEGVQTPTWSMLEAEQIPSNGSKESWFKRSPTAVALHPRLKPCGSGYQCPAFQAATNKCSIYPVRPLDCRLYPFVLTQDSSGSKVTLAMDTKCPYIQAHAEDPDLIAYVGRLTRYLENEAASAYLQLNPEIAGSPWPEFVHVAALPNLILPQRKGLEQPHPALRALRLEDAAMLQRTLGASPHTASSYTAAALLGWSDLIRLWWMELKGALCIFAEQAEGYFMPLPPLGGEPTPGVLNGCWELLEGLNEGHEVSRIEGIEPSEREIFKRCGFELRQGESEYLYRLKDLATLRGDRFRSQRWAVNRARRNLSYCIRPFEKEDLRACLQLYTLWGISRQRKAFDSFPKSLIRDGLFFHRRLMMSHEELALMGRVCEVDGKIRGYTFGAALSKEVFCVFLEITDWEIPGLAQLLFQEFCQELQGCATLLNAMGDAGLPGLRRNKLSYRPATFASTAVATKKRS